MKRWMMLVLMTGMVTLGCGAAVQAFGQDTNAVAGQAALSAADQAKLGQEAGDLVALLPAKDQVYVKDVMELIALLALGGRALSGWKRAGIFGVFGGLFGGHNSPATPPNPNPPKGAQVLTGRLGGWLLAGGLAGMLMLGAGCAHTRTTVNTSGSGFSADAEVPIPGTQVTLIGLKLWGGTLKQTTVVEPVATNELHTASLAIAARTKGAQNVSGSVATNQSAGITAGEADDYFLVSGDTTATDASGTNVLRLDGYQGYDPRKGMTNSP